MPEIIEIKKIEKRRAKRSDYRKAKKREGVQSERESERESAEFRRDI